MTAKLYCFGESGNAYKCALAMTLADMPWQPVFVDFFRGETRTLEFRKLNPMGEVPVLVDGAETLSQSGMILDYIVGQTGQLGGRTKAEARQVWRWVLWDNQRLSGTVGTCRYLMNFAAKDRVPEGVVPFLQARLNSAYTILNDHLAARPWVAGGDGPTVADLACAGYLYYPEPWGFSRSDWPQIDRWLDRIAALRGWRHPYELMPGNALDLA
ncbi:glutathione S-transferase N-terminal domain-containing protein [Rhodobacter sp. Har01]|uniref:glutathione S-transferase family protein n=1 Tax=Rhodobacter sp. Har01 TaxID=2883999 RepID=UPI001D08DA0E|nr:glutathione S-transferase [Rhodobacter sp. Har01]MCB6179248.1 glutathione S-transferase N-terminal domain-containing protein [Rhodobacter sp. Har01]